MSTPARVGTHPPAAGNLASVAAEIETDLLHPLAPDEQASLRRMLLALLDAAKE